MCGHRAVVVNSFSVVECQKNPWSGTSFQVTESLMQQDDIDLFKNMKREGNYVTQGAIGDGQI